MTMKRYVIPLSLCLATTASAQDREPDSSGSYLCKTTAIGGIAQGLGDVWQAAKFEFGDESYVVKVKHSGNTRKTVLGERRIYNIAVKQYGSQEDFADCYSSFADKEILSYEYRGFECHSFPATHHFKFDLHNGRFQIIQEGDYMERLPRREPQPATITVGKCDKID